MTIIWYNPDHDNYQKGSIKEYDRQLLKSINRDRYDIVYQFNITNNRLIDKVLVSLNNVHQIHMELMS